MKIDKLSYPNGSYDYDENSWHFIQYIQYEKRTIQVTDYGRLYHDRGYKGNYDNTVKHFQFKLDGKDTSLGKWSYL